MLFLYTLSMLLSVLSTAIMGYISMATPIGPWIAPTLVLFARLAGMIIRHSMQPLQLGSVVAAGSLGGIIATACGFSFPTLYFLDPLFFNQIVEQPFLFVSLLTALTFTAGWFGMWVANVLEHKLIVEDNLAFPIGILVHKMIAATDQLYSILQLVAGFCVAVATGISTLPLKILNFSACLPRTIMLLPAFTYRYLSIPMISIETDIMPMIVAIGFVTGHAMTVSLLIGMVARITVIDPVGTYFFAHLSSTEFLLAFCSGMIGIGVLKGIANSIKNGVRAYQDATMLNLGTQKASSSSAYARIFNQIMNIYDIIKADVYELVLILIITAIFLSYLQLAWYVQLYWIACTYACVAVMATIAGKIGMAQLGRFATFGMVPAMILFSLNYVQTVFIASFIEIAGGVAVDVLFGRKMARLSGIEHHCVKKFQYIGLVVSCLSVGVIFWLFVSHFQLGSDQLFAYKAQARHLLITINTFDTTALLFGMGVGLLLHMARINTNMMLGGFLMPINITLGLVVGGLLSYLSKHREHWYPFWSGMFAGNSLWMLINALR